MQLIYIEHVGKHANCIFRINITNISNIRACNFEIILDIAVNFFHMQIYNVNIVVNIVECQRRQFHRYPHDDNL